MLSHQASATLEPRPPFDFQRTLDFLRDFRASPVDRVVGEASLTQAFMIEGQHLLVTLQDVGTLEHPRLACQVHAEEALTDDRLRRLLDRLRFVLGLDDDLTPLYEEGTLDDAFRPVLDRLYGYHHVRFSTVFECACWALITQRTPNPYAYRSMRRLTEASGSFIPFGGKHFYTFPEPQAVLAADPRLVLEATNNTRKTERLLKVACSFMGVDEAFLRTAPFDEVRRWLKGITGIGDWSADYILLRGLGRMERIPWSDTWLVEAVSAFYAGGLPLSHEAVREIAKHYGDCQGYWLHYLKVAYQP
jgi:DNA-3-methyladenine glycosylase II